MKKILISSLLIALSMVAWSQNRRFQYKQHIPMKYWVMDSYTIKNGDKLTLDSGSVVTSQKEVEKKGIKTSYISFDTLDQKSSFYFDKTKEYKRKLPGLANVYIKDDDYSKIYLDYWLTTPTYFTKGTPLVLLSEGNKPKNDTLKSSSLYRYYTIPDEEEQKIKPVPAKIESLTNQIDSISSLLYNGTGQVNYVEAKLKYQTESLVDKPLDSNSKALKKLFEAALRAKKKDLNKELNNIYKNKTNKNYLWSEYTKEQMLFIDGVDTTTYFKKYPEKAYIKLENRQYIKLKFSAWEMAALTIPFKYRPEVSKDDITVPSVFKADVNLSTFLGHTCGSLTYRHQASEKVKPQGSAFSKGVFFGVSVAEIDSTSTSLRGAKALTEKRTVLSLTPGFGAMYNFMDFNIGLFVGWDIGVGEVGRKWNYHQKPWLGFGIGYNITMIGKKDG